MEKIFKLLILAIVQGITEVFPISSSGHLLIGSNILNIEMPQSLIFYLHFWTGLGLVIFYRKEIIELLKLKRKNFLISLVVATIPGAVIGFLLDDIVEQALYSTTTIAIALFSIGLIMILINLDFIKNLISEDKKKSIELNSNSKKKEFSEDEIPFWKTVLIGFAQTLAIIPGVSRSGICILTGNLLSIKYKKVLEIAFLLGIPMTLGPFVIKLISSPSSVNMFMNLNFLFYGVIAMGVELACLSILKGFKNYRSLIYFGIYRIIIATLQYIIV